MASVPPLVPLAFLGVAACASTPGDGATTPPGPSASIAASAAASAVVVPAASSATGTPPPTASAAVTTPASVTKVLFVDSKRIPCEGEGITECLRVRESEAEPWSMFYRSIEGFTHEVGYRFELRVEISDTATPPADASSKRYRLIEVVSKKKVP